MSATDHLGPQFSKRIGSKGLHGELSYDLEVGSEHGAAPRGYDLQGTKMVVHDPTMAHRAMDNLRDMWADKSYEPGYKQRSAAFGRLRDEIGAHYGIEGRR